MKAKCITTVDTTTVSYISRVAFPGRGAPATDRKGSIRQRKPVPCDPAVLMRIELDAAPAVENQDGTVVLGVSRPVVARNTNLAETTPAALHLVADPKGGTAVGGGGQQCAKSGAIDVEDGKQFVAWVAPKPDQRSVRGA